MRYLLLTFVLFLPVHSFGQDDLQLKEYSFTEFFQMIEDEEDSLFTLNGAVIKLDTITDKNYLSEILLQGIGNFEPLRKDTILIKKALKLENVFFDPTLFSGQKYKGILDRIIFQEAVEMINVTGYFHHIDFKKFTRISINEELEKYQQLLPQYAGSWTQIKYSTFNRINVIMNNAQGQKNGLVMRIEECDFYGNGISQFAPKYLRDFTLSKNKFYGEDLGISFGLSDSETIVISDNDFGDNYVELYIRKGIENSLSFTRNKVNVPAPIFISDSPQDVRIDWEQFQSGILDGASYYDFQIERFEISKRSTGSLNASLTEPESYNPYLDSIRFQETRFYKGEMRLLGTLNSIYKRQHDTESANASYITLKDLETARLKYLYGQNPSFDTFFEWKVNQFLKTFSDYGTRPAKAITMSVYVVFIFALIYLFFPNHWDSHGKNRIIDRFSFFLKYMKRDAGMHDVYLEEKQGDILAYDDYKLLLESSGKDVPKFFQVTGLPLYKWAISSTKMTAGFLSRVDVMKGTWSELPTSKRVWKSTLLITAFLIALTYDILIKMLNALMLSINTFTTLGFGEIPIKGLPRYLAIIQGFIGWFMLTIFSVSLISQLLN